MGPMPQKMARKAITTMISGATSAMWASVQKAVAAARPPLEKVAESMLEPLFEKEKEIQVSPLTHPHSEGPGLPLCVVRVTVSLTFCPCPLW